MIQITKRTRDGFCGVITANRSRAMETAKDIFHAPTLEHWIRSLDAMTPRRAALEALRVASFLPDDGEQWLRRALTANSD